MDVTPNVVTADALTQVAHRATIPRSRSGASRQASTEDSERRRGIRSRKEQVKSSKSSKSCVFFLFYAESTIYGLGLYASALRVISAVIETQTTLTQRRSLRSCYRLGQVLHGV